MKIVQEQRLQLKINFLLDYNMKVVILLEGISFQLVGALPTIPSVGKIMHAAI